MNQFKTRSCNKCGDESGPILIASGLCSLCYDEMVTLMLGRKTAFYIGFETIPTIMKPKTFKLNNS